MLPLHARSDRGGGRKWKPHKQNACMGAALVPLCSADFHVASRIHPRACGGQVITSVCGTCTQTCSALPNFLSIQQAASALSSHLTTRLYATLRMQLIMQPSALLTPCPASQAVVAVWWTKRPQWAACNVPHPCPHAPMLPCAVCVCGVWAGGHRSHSQRHLVGRRDCVHAGETFATLLWGLTFA